VTVGGVVRVDEDGPASLPAPPDENTTVWTKELTAPDTVGAYIVSVKVWAKTDQTEVEADVQSMQLNVQSGCSPKWVTVSDPTWNNPTTIRIDYTMNECNLLSGFGFHGVIRFSDTVKVDGYSMTTESSSYAIISKQYLAEQGITTFPISNVNVDLVDDDLGWVWDSRTVTIPVPPVQKDVVVCDFNVLTSDGIKVTTLGVGVPYTVRAYVCMKEDILGIGGCKFGALGCSEGYTTPPTRFTCTLLATPTKTLKTGTTDSTCQASFSYTPSSSPVGTATLRMAFGSTSTTKAITADLPITILGDQLVINVENVPEHGCCLEILAKFLKVPFTNTWWAPIVIRKSVDVASTVTLTPSDGLVVGKDYAIRCVPRPATYPGLICWPESQTAETAEFFTFTGTVTKTVQGYTPAPGWMQWFCNRFGVSTTNCYSAWAEIPTELIFTQEAWCCWLNKTNLAGEPCTLTNWDRLYIGLDLFGIIPVGKVADIGVKGIARGAYLGKAVTLGDNAGFKVSEWLATKFAKRELLAKCFARMSDEKYVVTMGKLLDGELDEGETLIRSMLNTPDVRDKALVDLLKNQIDDILDVGKKGVGTADENAAAARAIAKESGTIVVHFDEAFAEASKHVSDIPALQKYFREVVLWKNMDEFDRAIVDSIQAGEEYLTKAIPGSEALHPTGIRLLDLYRVEGFIDDVRVTKLGTRLDFALDVAMQDIARDPDLFRKLVGGLELNDAVKIFNNLNARGKKTEAEVYHALRLAADYKLEDGAVDFLSRTAIILKDSVANGTDNTIKAAQSVFNSLQKIIKPTAEEAAKFGLVDNAVTTAPAHQKRFLSKLWGTIKSVIERKSGKAWASLSNSDRLVWYLRSFFNACFMLFIAEEALQIAACFSVFPASGFIDQYWYQRTTVEKKQDIADYKGAVDRARTFWWVVVINELPFFILCPEFAPMYLAFSKGADMYLDEHEKNATKLESLINPTGNFTGNLRISANVNDVSIIINGMSYKQKVGTYPLDYLVPIDDVSVINEYTVQGDKVGYLTDIKTAQLSSADITPGGGYPTRNVYLELKPVSNVPGYTDATGIVTSPDTLREEIGGESYYNHMPTNLGGTVDNELWFSGNVGNIYCESTPQNAKIWIKGGQYTDWFDTARSTNWTITSIVVGSYQIKYTSPGYFDCIVPVNVVADQTAQANCIMQKILPPASLRCINPQPTSLTLAWAPPSITSTYLSQLKSYRVYKGAAQIATVGHVAGKTSYEYTVTNLTANTQYVFSVYSVTTGDIVSQDPATVSCTTSSICPKVTSVSIAPSTKTIKVGDSLTFTPSGSPGSGATLTKAQWQFSDTGTTTTVTPPDNILKTVTHTYTKTSGTTPFTVKLTLWNDCGESTVSSPAQITVETPIEPTGTIRCYCAGYPVTDEYCKRGADILYRKVGATTWSTAPVKTGYDAQLVVPEGQYQIKYNLMGVMESDIKTVTVSQAAAVTYQEQLAFGVISETGQRVVPSVPTQAVVDGANSILTTVTAVLDGDTIQTAWTDNTTVFPAPSGRTTQVVRIGGYDAFEYDQTNPTSTPMGVYAKNKLASLLLIGSVVTIKVHKYSPLDLYNRVLAAAERVAAGVDVTRDMLSSCYVKAPASGYKTGLWADWDAKYLALYKDPYGTSCLRKTDPQGNPYIKITDIDVSTRTFKLTNAWATVYAYAQWSKAGAVQGRTEIRSLASSSTSTAYAYSIGADTIELFACLDSERDCTCLDRPTEADNATCIARWVRVDTKFITVPIYKSVTLQSVPNCTNMVIDGGAPVSCGSAVSRLQQTLKRRRVRP